MRVVIPLTIYTVNRSETIRPPSSTIILLTIANVYCLHMYEVRHSFQPLREGSTI